ncbi:MAG: tRNA (guanosine(46)-N7)-methyltransferase TrmB [Magnetococcales bacterium]|nr:tRNA (guanosine(46)-N7)-methyltransferase TrmB [Magnetococcales bacterium]
MNLSPEEEDRRRFKTFGRKKGYLRPGETLWLEETLFRYELPPTADRAALAACWRRPPARLWLEVGFGNGDCLAHLAARHPGDGFIGVEVFLEGIAALVKKVERAGCDNVRVVRGHVHPVLRDRLPEGVLDRVIINFPDPWPKARHHKRRLIQTPFLDLLATRMVPGGELTLATDWVEYADWMAEVLGAHPAFQGGAAPEPAEWVVTRFQEKGLRAGRPPRHFSFRRR